MDDPFSNLIDELQLLAAEEERPHLDEAPALTGATSDAEPAQPAAGMKPPAMPLPRHVRGRRY
jgi:hypothetical protein